MEFIKQLIEFQIEQNLIEYPINLIKLCHDNNWKLHPYTNKDAISKVYRDGFSSSYDIFYNIDIGCHQRIRFTIAHEIGHIVLNHHILKNVNEECERAADYFAANLLAPAVILKNNYEFRNNPKFTQDYFNISEKCAINRIQHLRYWDRRIRYPQSFEKLLIDTMLEKIYEEEQKYINDYLSEIEFSFNL